MTQRRPLLFTVPMLAFAAGCLLDTTPLADGSTSAAGSQAVGELPTQATPQDAGRDSAMPAASVAAMSDAGIAVVTSPPQPKASNGMTDAGGAPPVAPNMTDAGNTKPPVQSCNATGSYGLRATMDVTWDATPWFDVGRGSVELYGLVRVETSDPQTHKASASFQVCGLSLPALNSNALCSRYQLQFPPDVWDQGKLAEQKLEGTYDCDASQCSLAFSPLSYAMGIELAEPNGPWPELKDTSPAQFSDDDADGFPGVSVDVVSIASASSGPNVCTAPSGPTAPKPGNGNSGNGNSGPKTPLTAATMPAPIGRLQLGLRTQLRAAMKLAPDCRLEEPTAAGAALDLRAAGCFVMEGTDPASASAACSEELRANFDDTLPHYDALEKGEMVGTTSSGPGSTKPAEEPGEGASLQVVRFAPGTQVGCEQVRSTMF